MSLEGSTPPCITQPLTLALDPPPECSPAPAPVCTVAVIWKHSSVMGLYQLQQRSCDGRWWPGCIVWAWMRSPATRCWSAFDCTRCLYTQLYCTLYTALYCTAGCTVHRLTASCSWCGAVELGSTQICLAQALKYDFGRQTWKILSSVLEMSQRVIYFRKNDYEWKWKLLLEKAKGYLL